MKLRKQPCRPTWKPLYAAHNARVENWSNFVTRMMRGQYAQVRLEVRPIERVTYAVSIYKFRTVMHNVGQVTVRTCVMRHQVLEASPSANSISRSPR